jgi:hypothetical protein
VVRATAYGSVTRFSTTRSKAGTYTVTLYR